MITIDCSAIFNVSAWALDWSKYRLHCITALRYI